MDIPQLLKTAIAELDVNLEEELSRYQYWRKHGKVPTVVSRFTQRSKPRPIPPEPPPVVPQSSPSPQLDAAEPPPNPVPPPIPEKVTQPPVQDNWLDFPTAFAALALMIVLGTVGYIAAEMLQLDRGIPKPDSPTPTAQPQLPNPIAAPPVSVRPPLPDPSIENLPPIQSTPPSDAPTVYRVVVPREYFDRVQALEPGAFVRPADGKVQVAALQNREEAENLRRRLEEQNIPAAIEE